MPDDKNTTTQHKSKKSARSHTAVASLKTIKDYADNMIKIDEDTFDRLTRGCTAEVRRQWDDYMKSLDLYSIHSSEYHGTLAARAAQYIPPEEETSQMCESPEDVVPPEAQEEALRNAEEKDPRVQQWLRNRENTTTAWEDLERERTGGSSDMPISGSSRRSN